MVLRVRLVNGYALFLKLFVLLFVMSSCTTTFKIPLERQSGCDFDPKNQTYSEWTMRFDQYPEIMNDSSVHTYFKRNLRFSKKMIRHEIRGRIMIKSYINTRGKLIDFRVYDEGEYIDGYNCTDCKVNEINDIKKDCKKEAIRLLKGMNFSPAVLKGQKVNIEMLYNVNFYYSDYIKGEYNSR